MGIFGGNSNKLVSKLKARTRQLSIMQELSRIRDSTESAEDFLNKSVAFASQEILSRFVCVVGKRKDGFEIVASTVPHIAAENTPIIIDLAKGAALHPGPVVINRTRKHPRLRMAGVECAAVAAMRLKGEIVGALVVFRFRRVVFGPRSVDSIMTFANQIPPALDYVVAGEDSNQKTKELAIIDEIDKIRERFRQTQMVADSITELMLKNSNAKGAFITIFGKEGTLWSGAGSASAHRGKLEALAKSAVNDGEMITRKLGETLNEAIVMPISAGEENGALGLVNPRDGDFSEIDKRVLATIARHGDSALFEDQEKKMIKDVFARYVSSDVLELVLRDQSADMLKPVRREATLLFCDIRGFTSMSEQLPPEKVVQVLNEYFTEMTNIILDNKGMLDKFVGDEIVAIFGAPVYFEDHAKRAVETAVQMQSAFKKLASKWKKQGVPVVGLGVGIDSGHVVIGPIGGEQRSSYTAIGDHVNTASRLCGAATDGQILITDETYGQVRSRVLSRLLAPLTVKGKSKALTVHNVTGLR